MRIRATPRRLRVLATTVERLVESAAYPDLIDLVDTDLGLIADCAEGRLPYQQRRARLVGTPEPRQSQALIELAQQLPFQVYGPPRPPVPWYQRLAVANSRFWAAFKRGYVATLPSDTPRRGAASKIVDILCRTHQLTAFIAEHRPAFGARLMRLEIRSASDFSDAFLSELCAKPESALYREVANNQNFDRCGYYLPERNVILHSLFSDAKIAERLAVYQPVGEYAIARLNPVNDAAYCASLNSLRDRHWDDHGRWRDPTYMSIRYFDIMVQTAACQGVAWHMWLYYIPPLVEEITKIYELADSETPQFGEYRTRASYLLYAAFDALSDWVRLAAKVPPGSPHAEPENDRVDHDNGNIPKSAALALGIALRRVIPSDRVDYETKGNLLEVAIRAFRDFPRNGGLGRLRQVTIASIAKGGLAGAGADYERTLSDLYGEIDRPWQNDLDDFEQAIGYQRWPDQLR